MSVNIDPFAFLTVHSNWFFALLFLFSTILLPKQSKLLPEMAIWKLWSVSLPTESLSTTRMATDTLLCMFFMFLLYFLFYRHAACSYGQVEVAKYLLDNGAGILLPAGFICRALLERWRWWFSSSRMLVFVEFWWTTRCASLQSVPNCWLSTVPVLQISTEKELLYLFIFLWNGLVRSLRCWGAVRWDDRVLYVYVSLSFRDAVVIGVLSQKELESILAEIGEENLEEYKAFLKDQNMLDETNANTTLSAVINGDKKDEEMN